MRIITLVLVASLNSQGRGVMEQSRLVQVLECDRDGPREIDREGPRYIDREGPR